MKTNEFLHNVYGSLRDGYLSVTILENGKSRTRWFDTEHLDEMAAYAVEAGKTCNTYFGVNPRTTALGEFRRGDREDISAVIGTYTDFDIKGDAHKEKNLPKTKEVLMAFLMALPIQPTIIIESGNGIHAYWLFKEIFYIGNESDRDYIEKIVKGWESFVKDKTFRERGWKFDSVSDLPRMLRAVGTINHKTVECPVSIVASFTEDRYSPSDFEGYVKASFGCSALSGSNAVTGQLTLAQVGGGYSTSSAIASGTARILGGSLAVDATFSVMITLTDTVGKTSSYAGEISSATYIMHVKKGGRAVGFGMAAGADDTVSFGWPVILDAALQVASTGSGVTPRAQSARNLLFLGTNLEFQDTVANWSAQGFGWAWYTTATVSSVTNKPTTYGFLMNIPITGATEVHQLYFAQSHGAIYHRGGNGSGWGGNWKTLFDSATVVPISAGGTGQTSAAGIRNAIGLGNTTGALPIANGGHGATSAKQGLINLGVFYSATLPASGTDGQVCLVPVS